MLAKRALCALMMALLLGGCGYHLRGAQFNDQFPALMLVFEQQQADFAEPLQQRLQRQGIAVVEQSPYQLWLHEYLSQENEQVQTGSQSLILLEQSVQVQLLGPANQSLWGTVKLHEGYQLVSDKEGTDLDEVIERQQGNLNQKIIDRILEHLQVLPYQDWAKQ